MTKGYKQLIINRLKEIKSESGVDITGNCKHGFKQKRSTAMVSLTLQSVLSHALKNNNYSKLASIELSVAFNVVNINLLLKILKILGLPADIFKYESINNI